MSKQDRRLLWITLGLVVWTGWASALAADWGAVLPPPGGDFQPAAAPFRETLCLGVKFSQGEPLANLPNLSELGVRWVRDHVGWATMEPTAGRFLSRFPNDFQQRLDYYRSHGIGVVFMLAYGNQKAYPNTPENPTNSVNATGFARYAAQVARLMKASGVSFVLEVWNEPHNDAVLQKFGGNWQGKAPSPWVDQYIKIAQESVRAVKAIDPSIKILSDDDMWVVHYWFLEAGLPKEIAGFAVHPYNAPANPEYTAVAYDTDWTRPFKVVDQDRSFRSAVRRLRDQGKTKLGYIPEIWITEWGWPLEGAKGSVPESTLVAYLPRAYILAAAAGIKATCWFSSYDAVDGPMGLTRNNGQHRQTYFAYQTMARQLGDMVLLSQLAGTDHPASGIQGFVFTGARGRKLVVWSVEGATPYLSFPANEKTIEAVDVLGKPVALDTSVQGRRRVKLGAAPVYVSGTWLDAPLDISVNY
ncbi:cellulase family glycosylhydrolase [Methylomagnum ishizawai]|uniref:cellulase family glycosylhydrolase n=1 Tax=Methylomagnum ishizawai TaxID=1760988 RepID=UPI001C321D81|nr:cellulase family glycosylhydrolase [Methylomagnum ishizawai]BBL72985.1 hypothetical protein MishRS11D_00830 [Methylomagnum ishizawai]